MFSSHVVYEGLDTFLKSGGSAGGDKNPGLSVFRNGNNSDDSQSTLPAYGYATANSSPVVETRVRSRSHANKQRKTGNGFASSVNEAALSGANDCPTYEGVSALSSFGRPLSKLSTNTNVTSLLNTPDHKISSGFQHYEMGIYKFVCPRF